METTSFEEHEKLRELHEEEERMKLRMLQADAGLIAAKDLLVTAERMDWMYMNPAQAKQENEDFLLGKPLSASNDERAEMRKRLGVGTTSVGSLFLSSVTSQNDDTLRRLREDPLFSIRQAEHQQRRKDLAREKILKSMKPKLEKKHKDEIVHQSWRSISGTRQSSTTRYQKQSLSPYRNERNHRGAAEFDDRQSSVRDDHHFLDSWAKKGREMSRRYDDSSIRKRDTYHKTYNKRPPSVTNRSKASSRDGVADDGDLRYNGKNDCAINRPLATQSNRTREIRATSLSLSRSPEARNQPPIASSPLDLCPRGPVLPREWKETLKKQAESSQAAPGSASEESSSDDDVAPPSTMMTSITKLRQKKEQLPLLWKTRGVAKAGRPGGMTRTFDISAEVQREAALKLMEEDGKRHEIEKDAKLRHLEEVERVREKRDLETRDAADQRDSTFLKLARRTAYADESMSLEERVKRYATRRHKTTEAEEER